jgi:hypothetical protein
VELVAERMRPQKLLSLAFVLMPSRKRLGEWENPTEDEKALPNYHLIIDKPEGSQILTMKQNDHEKGSLLLAIDPGTEEAIVSESEKGSGHTGHPSGPRNAIKTWRRG